ncbi:AbrB/MazE/SpoVT family DNA-binding domain-containing protein [Methanobrevibacter sp. DSM 116169]|uniref:AbrB/MazE/SpoVT family DNA-binding domain-containing protein n=1 Tax=Methanobrevibacter sp. DSM 116169 TaxID=3242727 RepID=UPI0038FC08EC
MISTKVYKGYQTVIPAEIRKEFDIEKGDILEWNTNNKDEISFKVRKKRQFKDIRGIIKLNETTNAVQLKKELYL